MLVLLVPSTIDNFRQGGIGGEAFKVGVWNSSLGGDDGCLYAVGGGLEIVVRGIGGFGRFGAGAR